MLIQAFNNIIWEMVQEAEAYQFWSGTWDGVYQWASFCAKEFPQLLAALWQSKPNNNCVAQVGLNLFQQ